MVHTQVSDPNNHHTYRSAICINIQVHLTLLKNLEQEYHHNPRLRFLPLNYFLQKQIYYAKIVTWCQILANQTYGQNEVANV